MSRDIAKCLQKCPNCLSFLRQLSLCLSFLRQRQMCFSFLRQRQTHVSFSKCHRWDLNPRPSSSPTTVQTRYTRVLTPVSGRCMGSQADALPLSYGGFVHLLNLLEYFESFIYILAWINKKRCNCKREL
jgi:hypothetical protein